MRRPGAPADRERIVAAGEVVLAARDSGILTRGRVVLAATNHGCAARGSGTATTGDDRQFTGRRVVLAARDHAGRATGHLAGGSNLTCHLKIHSVSPAIVAPGTLERLTYPQASLRGIDQGRTVASGKAVGRPREEGVRRSQQPQARQNLRIAHPFDGDADVQIRRLVAVEHRRQVGPDFTALGAAFTQHHREVTLVDGHGLSLGPESVGARGGTVNAEDNREVLGGVRCQRVTIGIHQETLVGHQAGREAVLGLSEAGKEGEQQCEDCRHLAPANRRGGNPQEERALEGLDHSV